MNVHNRRKIISYNNKGIDRLQRLVHIRYIMRIGNIGMIEKIDFHHCDYTGEVILMVNYTALVRIRIHMILIYYIGN